MIYDDIGYFSPAGFQITGNVQKPVKIPEKICSPFGQPDQSILGPTV
jgi:hypothetical protein